jgi:hypothetical protein
VAYVLDAVALDTKDRKSDIEAMIAHASVHLGLKENAATVSLVKGENPKSRLDGSGEIDLGWVLYDLRANDRSNPKFVRLKMLNGVVDIPEETEGEFAS